MNYKASSTRYESMEYRYCGNSGLKLPLLSLGLWHNFGDVDSFKNGQDIIHTAFDHGITHFDLANNYGPPPGSAERNFGKMLATSLKPYRNELIISSKAGWEMWPGPYGNFGSRKYLFASLHDSLKRLQTDYVDIFYHHRPDPDTPLEESMTALHDMVKQGKALYIGISSYNAEETQRAATMLNELGTPCLIHQPRYNLFDRWVEDGLLDVVEDFGIGVIPFSPLNQGILTDKYIDSIPEDSRVAKESGFLQTDDIQRETIEQVKKLNAIAKERNQSLAQMAIAWLLNNERVTSVLVGVSKVEQLMDNLGALEKLAFSEEELAAIDNILASG